MLRFLIQLDILIWDVEQSVQQGATWFVSLLQNYNITKTSRSIRRQAAMVWFSRSGSSRSLCNVFQYENIRSLRERVVMCEYYECNAGCAIWYNATRLGIEQQSKKACVTASARVWYLEPKWLRWSLLASMRPTRHPGVGHFVLIQDAAHLTDVILFVGSGISAAHAQSMWKLRFQIQKNWLSPHMCPSKHYHNKLQKTKEHVHRPCGQGIFSDVEWQAFWGQVCLA